MKSPKFVAITTLCAVLCPQLVFAIFLIDEGISKCESGSFDARVVQGDYKAINLAFEERSLMCLWHYFVFSANNRYGRGRTEKEEAELKQTLPEAKRLELNQVLMNLAGDYLRQLPGHAEYVDEWIDKTWEAQRAPTRENAGLHYLSVAPYFRVLVNLGSPECVEVLLGHLDDDRSLGQNSAGRNPTPLAPNWFQLIDVLGEAHGSGKQPWAGLPLRQGGGLKVAEMQRRMLKDWWASPASAPYKVETSKAGAKAPATGASGPGMDHRSIGPEVPEWILILLCVGGLVVGAILAAKKRKK